MTNEIAGSMGEELGRDELGMSAKRTFCKRMVQTKWNQCKYVLGKTS
jgi:hypothetical protein